MHVNMADYSAYCCLVHRVVFMDLSMKVYLQICLILKTTVAIIIYHHAFESLTFQTSYTVPACASCRLQAEVEEVLEGRTKVTYEDLEKLQYTEQVSYKTESKCMHALAI